MTTRKPFPLVGALAAALASYGFLHDRPVLALPLGVLFALVGVLGSIVYQKRRLRA